MRSLIVISAVLSSLTLAAQQQLFKSKDTLFFAADSSYSRDVIRIGKQLVFATSKTGVVELNEKTGETNRLILDSPSGEFRSVLSSGSTTLGMISGDNGEVWLQEGTHRELIVSKPGLFFDDMDRFGNVVTILGDPVNGRFALFQLNLITRSVASIVTPQSIDDEACYAASGRTILQASDSVILFVSGGSTAARFHRTNDGGKTWLSVNLPMQTGEGCGPFSLHFINDREGMIVGGCYADPNQEHVTSLYTNDGGITWQKAETHGYRSAVTGNEKVQFACGTNGLEISTDKGKSWQLFDKGNFCALLLEKKYLYATTNKGYCIRYRLKR